MKTKWISIILALLFVPSFAAAQGTAIGMCEKPTGGFKACQADASGNQIVTLGGGGTATFAAMDATTTIGAAYASAVNLPDDTKVVILDNQTNGDVTVSMDGGTSDTFHIKAGDVLSLNLAAAGLETTADVQIKDGTTASSSGTFYVYSIK